MKDLAIVVVFFALGWCTPAIVEWSRLAWWRLRAWLREAVR